MRDMSDTDNTDDTDHAGSVKRSIGTIDEYIAGFDAGRAELLRQMRATIREEAPAAAEKISYGMPTFHLHGNLVHFAAFAGHIGFYPAPQGIDAFKEDLAAYKGAKGSVRFPLDRPLPLDLVRRIVRFRVEENEAAHRSKTKRR